MTVRRWTLVALAALLWIAGAYATRDVDSDRPTSSAVPIAGEEVGTAEHAWADPPRRAAGDVARNASPAAKPRASRAARTRTTLNWHALALCESSGNPRAVSRSGKYRGLYQMDADFWRTYGGLRYAPRPDLATSAEQTRVAANGYATRGRQPWPYCGRFL